MIALPETATFTASQPRSGDVPAAGMPPAAGVILCVDDEPNILSALRRLFRPLGCEVVTAESARAGLQLLETRHVDLVISDMRMPGMDGAAFLECVRGSWPDTIRILLTGYADVQLILGAINRGEIYRYLTKPWDDHDILLTARQALERRTLEQEKRRLEAVTLQQNEQLRQLNATLEAKVAHRTADLTRAHAELVVSSEKVKASFLTSIKVLSSIIEMRAASLAGHSRRVADLARRIALRLSLEPAEAQTIFIAALLHNLGKVGFSDELLAMPVSLMNGEQLGLYRRYPLRGEQLLMPLEELQAAAAIVRAHQERFDGEGFPDRLAGFDIPLGARILAVASDYDKLQIGLLMQRQLRPDQAMAAIADASGRRYDPAVVTAFHETVCGAAAVEPARDEALPVSALRAGMITTRDLMRRDGSLLLSAEHVLNDRLIQQIADFEKTASHVFTVHVRPGKE